jgi:predicted nucleic acid-binding protein
MGLEENRYVLDTNILLYWLGDRLENKLPQGTYLVSVISEIELLSYAGLDLIAEQQIREFLSKLVIVGLREDVKEYTIALRKKYRLKLPDAAIAATALAMRATLLTNDMAFLKLTEISVESLPLKKL